VPSPGTDGIFGPILHHFETPNSSLLAWLKSRTEHKSEAISPNIIQAMVVLDYSDKMIEGGRKLKSTFLIHGGHGEPAC